MASDGRADSSVDQSSQCVSSAAAAKSKGGRPPTPIKEEFIKVGSSENASKRATYDCKHCNTSFTELGKGQICLAGLVWELPGVELCLNKCVLVNIY